MIMIVSSQIFNICFLLLLSFVIIICNNNNNNNVIVLAADTTTTTTTRTTTRTRTTTTKSNPGRRGQQLLLTQLPPLLLLHLQSPPQPITTTLLQWKQKQRKHQRITTATATTATTATINTLRGGNNNNNNNNNNYFIEENPNYIHYTNTPSSNNEHGEWLNQQQQGYVTTTYKNNNNFYTSTTGRRLGSSNNSLLGLITNYFMNLHLYNPTLFYTTVSCVVVFILWRVPQLYGNPIFANLFICSRDTVIKTKGLSLFFASISHISIRHLLMNLITLLHIGPNVQSILLTKSKDEQQIWKLMLGSAITSNGFFVLLSSLGGQIGGRGRARRSRSSPAKACLGLSGVTMSLIAILASVYPNRIFGIMIFGIFPIRVQAKYILQGLMIISIIGSLIPSTGGGNNIAHLTHLGGLLYGILYYQLVIVCNKRPYYLFQKTKRNLQKSIIMTRNRRR